MKLANLASLIMNYAESQGNNDQMFLSPESIYRGLDFGGTRNQMLANPLNAPNNTWYFRSREKPLSGDEVIAGDYLVFSYCEHDGAMWLLDFDSIEGVKDHLIGVSGITNPFTTLAVPIVLGKPLSYSLTYLDDASDRRKPFIKTEQGNSPSPFAAVYSDIQLQWQD